MGPLIVGRGAIPWAAASELLDELGVSDDQRRLHRPALALLEPALPMTVAQRERHARMRLLNDLPNVRMANAPLEEAFAVMLDAAAGGSARRSPAGAIAVAASERGWDEESAQLFGRHASLVVYGARCAAPAPGGEPEAERAFAAHAFSISAACAERWAREGEARAAYVAGLSAHHLDPFDAALSTRAARHLARAAVHTIAPVERAHACYRLAVHAVRHEGRPVDALDHADASLEASRSVERLREAHEAWARNARAFALTRLDRPADAASELERALAVLSGVDALPPLDRYVEESLETMTMNLRRVTS